MSACISTISMSDSGRAWCVAAERNGPDVSSDERLSLSAVAETALRSIGGDPNKLASYKRRQMLSNCGINRVKHEHVAPYPPFSGHIPSKNNRAAAWRGACGQINCVPV